MESQKLRGVSTRVKQNLVMDLDFLLAEKESTEVSKSEQASTTLSAAKDILDSDSEDEEEIKVQQQTSAILKIADDVSEKLQCDTEDCSEWTLGGDRVFSANMQKSIPGSTGETWEASKEVLDLLDCHMLGTYLKAIGVCKEAVGRNLFHTIAYSNLDHLELAACETLCQLVSNTNQVKNEWLPSPSDFMAVFLRYGYCAVSSSTERKVSTDEDSTVNLPQNIRSVLQFLSVNGRARKFHHGCWKADDILPLLRAVARFSLDSALLPLLTLIQECIDGLLEYHTKSEWAKCRSKFGKELSRTGKRHVDNVHVILNLPMVSKRSRLVQQIAAFNALVASFDKKAVQDVAESPAGVICLFTSINHRDTANYAKLLHQLKLADLCLSSSEKIENGTLKEWVNWLQFVSTRIPASDITSFAPQARNWAAFMLQKYNFMLTKGGTMET